MVSDIGTLPPILPSPSSSSPLALSFALHLSLGSLALLLLLLLLLLRHQELGEYGHRQLARALSTLSNSAGTCAARLLLFRYCSCTAPMPRETALLPFRQSTYFDVGDYGHCHRGFRAHLPWISDIVGAGAHITIWTGKVRVMFPCVSAAESTGDLSSVS
jgi:hypothetical protein